MATSPEPAETKTAELDSIYARRFDDEAERRKDRVWREIGRYLQRYVPPDAAVLDIASDKGYLIRNIQAAERWASDLRDVAEFLGPGIRFVQGDGLTINSRLPASHFDLICMSNYLEHLPESGAVIQQFRVAHALLKPGGRVLILQPNIRFVGGAYWDFIDHHVALTEHSLAEAAEIAGLTTVKSVPRFLPYTTKQILPQHPLLVRGYLAFRPAWRVLGKQTLYIAAKT